MTGQLGLEQFVEADPVALLKPRQKPVHATQRVNSVSEPLPERLERGTAGEGPIRNRTHHAQEIARAVLKFSHQYLQPLPALMQSLLGPLAGRDVKRRSGEPHRLAIFESGLT